MHSLSVTYACFAINFAAFLATQALNRMIVLEMSSYIQIFVYCILYAPGVVLLHLGVTTLFMPKARQYVQAYFRKHMT